MLTLLAILSTALFLRVAKTIDYELLRRQSLSILNSLLLYDVVTTMLLSLNHLREKPIHTLLAVEFKLDLLCPSLELFGL